MKNPRPEPQGSPPLPNRIRELRERQHMTQEELAAAIGTSKMQVSRLERGERRLTQSWMERIAQALQIHPAELLPAVQTFPMGTPRGAPPSREAAAPVSEVAPAEDHALIAAGALARDIPVLGTSRGGKADGGGDFELNGEVVDFARRPPGISQLRDVFALYVVGDSMAPWRQPGDLVYCTRSRHPRPGDYVVVELQAEEGEPQAALLKRLVGLRGQRLVLEQYNPREELKIDQGRIKQLYRVIDWPELRGV
jgi:phage repressor protein C with HTH and peptisase S24 domain